MALRNIEDTVTLSVSLSESNVYPSEQVDRGDEAKTVKRVAGSEDTESFDCRILRSETKYPRIGGPEAAACNKKAAHHLDARLLILCAGADYFAATFFLAGDFFAAGFFAAFFSSAAGFAAT